MADTNEALTIWSRLWDSLSSIERWVLGGALAITHATAFGGGVWLIYERSQNQIAATEAKYERQITDLQSQLVQAQSAPSKVIGSPLDGVPKLADAAFDETNLHGFASAYWNHAEAHRGHTKLQTPDFCAMHAGTRYQWAGYVSEVSDGGSDELIVTITDRVDFTPDMLAKFRTDPKFATVAKYTSVPRVFTVSCYFEKSEALEPLRKLDRGQWTELTGVLDDSGNLRRCRLEKTKPKAETPDWLVTGPLRSAIDWNMGFSQ